MEQRLLMLVGLAGSGKSTFAKEAMEGRDDIVYLSSDLIREELTGDENNQDVNVEVFNQMAIRTKEALNSGKHVIYDATNISRKRRKGFLQQLSKGVHKTAVYVATNYQTVLEQNENRERVVPTLAIDRMHKNLQIPVYGEGWDNIVIAYDDFTLNNELPKQFSDGVRAGVLLGREGYELMTFLATYFNEFFNIYDMPHDSKWHSLSVSRHTYHVYKHVLDNFVTDDDTEKEVMLWTALLHDTGKHFCKSFENRKREETVHANFIGHEHVSSQLSVILLKRLGFDNEFIHTVTTLTQLHMYLLDEKASHKKLKDLVGEDLFKKLEFLRDADTLAH